jgi:3-hydroxy-9,10-secoandrosta-1,3,5(10)-triene-9,17-dione monooxygenase
VDGGELLERVRKLVPGIRARAAEAESLRRLPATTLAELVAAGVPHALQPKRFGGHEVDVLSFFECVCELAAACPSTGWVAGVLGVHPWQLALFPEQAQRDVWEADPGALISSSYAPTGSVEAVDGGFRLGGRWSFSSGCDACSWVFLGGLARSPDAPPDMRTFLLPRSDYQIDDTWHVAGLAGSGSKDIVVEDAFVPEHRTLGFAETFAFEDPGRKINTAPLYRLSFGMVFAWGISVPAIGTAQGALEAYRAQMRAKLSVYGGGAAADDPSAQMHLAEASAEVSAAGDELRAVFGRALECVHAGRPLPMELRLRSRWSAAKSVQRAVRAVDTLFEAGGGRALFLSNPLQRYFRDVHAMRAHAMNNPERAGRVFGRAQLHPDEAPTDFLL